MKFLKYFYILIPIFAILLYLFLPIDNASAETTDIYLEIYKDKIFENRIIDKCVGYSKDGECLAYIPVVKYYYKDLMGIEKDEAPEKRDAYSRHYKTGTNTYTAEISGRPKYIKNKHGLWEEIYIKETSISNWNAQINSLGLWDKILGYSVYAQSISTTTLAGDGYSGHDTGTGQSWNAAYVGAGTKFNYTGVSSWGTKAQENSGYTNRFQIWTGFFPFYTGSIGDDMTISSSSLSVISNINSCADNDGNDFIAVSGTSTQASQYSLENSDHQDRGDLGSMRVSQDITIPGSADYRFWFNLTNLDEIIKKESDTSSCGSDNGFTCLSIRTGFDFNNHAISANINCYVFYYFSENGSNEPTLFVEYEEPIATGTPETQFSTSTHGSTDLTVIEGTLKEYIGTSTTLYQYKRNTIHVPFFYWLIIAVPTLWIGGRIVIEFIIKLRKLKK